MKNYKAGYISIVTLLSAATFTGCWKSGSEVPISETCPKELEQIERSSFEVDEPAATAVRAGFIASQQMQVLTETLDAELLESCAALAKDLFVTEKQLESDDFSHGSEALLACTLAGDAFEKLRGLAGGSLSVSVSATSCKTAMNASDDCFAACGGVAPSIECEGEVSGTCAGKCDGQCSFEGDNKCAGTCSGTCSGACDSEFEGTCHGKCEGQCDGKEAKGECAGTCVGRCMEGARGECGGTCLGDCQGTCTIEAAGECEGTCAGECDSPLTDTYCTGIASIAGDASDCTASCEAGLLTELECETPVVEVTIEEPENEDAAELLKGALAQHLPAILVTHAMQISPEQIAKSADSAKALVEAILPQLKGEGDKVDGKSKSCAEETTKNGDAAIIAIPTIMSATDHVRRIDGQ